MDMKKILQALDGAATKPVEGVSDMARFLRVVSENVVDGSGNAVSSEAVNLFKLDNQRRRRQHSLK